MDSGMANWEDIQKWFEKFKASQPKQEACPNCGYCPHCGRGGHQAYPVYPMYPSYPTYPWYQPQITWTSAGTVTGVANHNITSGVVYFDK